MRLCDETVTVYNARVDPESGETAFETTVIRGVSWFAQALSAVAESGVKRAARHVLRIPADADAGGRAWADPDEYARAADVSGLWTLRAGDVIAAGERAGDAPVMSARTTTVLGVIDNRRLPRAPHWKVIGG